MPISEVYNCDCLEYMRSLPDKYFDLCIADPPYGIGAKRLLGSGGNSGQFANIAFKTHNCAWDDFPPSQEVFDEIFRVSRHQIIWGGNYFDLPPTREVVCWDKLQYWPGFSQWEMGWTSFDGPAKLFRLSNGKKGKIHATQKPVELYAWLLNKYAKKMGGGKIFDPFLGSGSSRIAAYKMEYDFYACELDKDYYEAQEERFRRECLGEIKARNGTIITEQKLF